MQCASPTELAQAMGQLSPEDLAQVLQRAAVFNRIISEENAKTIPDYQSLMMAYAGLDALAEEFDLPKTYDFGKVKAEMYLKTTAPTTLQ
ncbi:hypothetical protein PU634_10535 [Oceanimonas pelagia]|uniref:Uncharacterized protein n=1 Tax=Oceanimonas pelagia TaxID=3028314 RepID=A0AA50KL68_9GAMM|nr:hypothetical protein [Oceanimonas pelagia]WMC09553.1 hypothetical protein PU634_10535 [Oceanimonas pelagia]